MTTPARVARSYVPTGSVWDLARNRDITTGIGKLVAQDVSATTDRPGVWLQWEMLAGWPVDHGARPDADAMLALHNYADNALEQPVPRYVAPGDSCTRLDDPGWRWHCISGHGITLADWERRPLTAALEGFAEAAELDGKQDTFANAAALAKVGEADGQPLWHDAPWPGGASSGGMVLIYSDSFNDLAAWTQDVGEWSVSGGVVTKAAGSTAGVLRLNLPSTMYLADLVAVVDIAVGTSVTSVVYAGIMANYKDVYNGVVESTVVRIKNNAQSVIEDIAIDRTSTVNYSIRLLGDVFPEPLSCFDWHTITYRQVGGSISAYLGIQFMTAARIETQVNQPKFVALRTELAGEVKFKEFKLYAPARLG